VQPLHLNAYTLATSIGVGLADTRDALIAGRCGLAPNDFEPAPLDCYIGRVRGLEEMRLPEALRTYDCRNNRLALLALEQDGFASAVRQAAQKYGPGRVAVVLGTSTSGILSTELAYAARDPQTGALPGDLRYDHTHNVGALSEFVRLYLGLKGPSLAISTACSSSAKVFASAQRFIASGLCDAAVVGGVDSLCLTTMFGFNSLQLVSRRAARPFDADRDGLSIGEGAGFALIERDATGADAVALLGYGESSDAHHMSAPHPEGRGAQDAMRQALGRASLGPDAIDYVHAHGTATRNNDSTEDYAVAEVFGANKALTSTKGAIGHTLGAAGIAGAVIAALSIRDGFVPATLNIERVDESCRSSIPLAPLRASVRRVLSNSFGFGGNNCSLVLGAA